MRLFKKDAKGWLTLQPEQVLDYVVVLKMPVEEALTLRLRLHQLCIDVALIRQLQEGHREESLQALVEDIIDRKVENGARMVHRVGRQGL